MKSKTFVVTAGGKTFVCQSATNACTEAKGTPAPRPTVSDEQKYGGSAVCILIIAIMFWGIWDFGHNSGGKHVGL